MPGWFFPTKSITVFCDDTINREADFLEPVIRVAHWDREADMQADLSFPNVQVTLGHSERLGVRSEDREVASISCFHVQILRLGAQSRSACS